VISGLAIATLLVSGVSAPLPLGLMTFNIRTAFINDGENAWPNWKALVAQAIERSAPDVVGLQEVIREQVEYQAATLDGYRGPPRPGDTSRIDWNPGRGPIQVQSADTILFNEAGRYPSDHFPVAARIEIR
jgi:endonuclease/exonuclease/phosphatase family metal-dependent hydrolase